MNMQNLINSLTTLSTDFPGFSESETVRFNHTPNSILLWDSMSTDTPPHLSLAFKGLSDEELADLDNRKFEILGLMEKIAIAAFSELTNNDACSFTYHFDTQHASGEPILTVSIIDYLS